MVWEIIQTVALGLSVGFAIHQQQKLDRIEGTVNGPVYDTYRSLQEKWGELAQTVVSHHKDKRETLENHHNVLRGILLHLDQHDKQIKKLEQQTPGGIARELAEEDGLPHSREEDNGDDL